MPWRQLIVEEQHVRPLRTRESAKLLNLAGSNIGLRIRSRQPLRDLTDDVKAGGVGQLAELAHRIRQRQEPPAFAQLRSNQHGTFLGRFGRRGRLGHV